MAALLKVDIYSHNFAVSDISPNVRHHVSGFARKWVQYGFIKEGGRWIRQAIKEFASYTKDRRIIRFHINQLNDFFRYMDNNGIDDSMMEIVRHPMYIPEKVELPVFDRWVPRDYQEPIIEYIIDPKEPKAKFVAIQTGKGKLQPLDAKIKIPGGWSTMGEMKVGTIITAKDGTPTKVTGVFPHGQKEIFKITFADGRSTEAGAEHLWRVYYINTEPHKRWRIVNTIEVLRLISMPNPRVYIDLIDAEDCSNIYLPIDPYILGIYLGDGCSAGGSVNITTPDEFIVNELKSSIGNDCSITTYSTKDKCQTYGITRNQAYDNIIGNPFKAKLRELDLDGKIHFEKFIPQIYLHASKTQRLALLQGLMDTDGTANALHTGGSISYSTVSEQLAKDVQYLVRSLGGIASISSRYPTFEYKGEKKTGRLAYNVNIRYKKPSELFRLPKKKERTNDDNQYAKDLKLRVVSVESAGFKETQCISIDHPEKLYVTDDFIVTHNTFSALYSASKLGWRLLIIVRPMFMDKWQEDVMKTYDIDFQDMVVIKGATSLLAVLEQAANDELTAKVILISNKTLQPYLKLYEQFQEQIRDLGYSCMPYDMCEALKVGTIIEDEIHLDFHLNHKLFTYTHVPKTISLSATLVSDDDFLNSMYENTFPQQHRYAGEAYHKYVNATALTYHIQNPNKVRCQDYSRKTYSHTMFEESIMKNPYLRNNYLEMIYKIAVEYWQNDAKPGDRCLIYCARIEFCTIVTEYLKKKFPNKDVRRYVEDDPYENVMTADISVSTVGSAGTGLDIPNLTTVLLTVAINSSASNIQGLGRLRDLGEKKTKFIYFTCIDIPKHRDYHERKRVLLKDRALTYTERQYAKTL